jgi:tight adherence protein C
MPLFAVVGLVFIGAALALFFLFYLFLPRKTVLEERLETMRPLDERLVMFEKPKTGWQKFLSSIGKYVPLKPEYKGRYARMLVAAGLRKEGLPVFLGAKVVFAAALPIAYLLLYGLPVEKDYTTRVLLTAVFAIGGFLIPSLWLTRKLRNRQLNIFLTLPDVLDLMTVCVEAGVSMDAAMIRVCDDPQFKKSPLITEMKTALQETRAGKPRIEALRDMGERTMVDDLKAFAALLIQTERLGTSLAQSLRVHSDSLRTIRRQRAEEAAAKTAVKLVFPLVFFIFPALLIVILGPGVIRIMRLFASL